MHRFLKGCYAGERFEKGQVVDIDNHPDRLGLVEGGFVEEVTEESLAAEAEATPKKKRGRPAKEAAKEDGKAESDPVDPDPSLAEARSLIGRIG